MMLATFDQVNFDFSPLRDGRRSKSLEIKIVARDAEVFDDVGDNPAWDIPRVIRKGNQTVRAKWVRIVAVTTAGSHQFTADLTQTAFQLPAIV